LSDAVGEKSAIFVSRSKPEDRASFSAKDSSGTCARFSGVPHMPMDEHSPFPASPSPVFLIGPRCSGKSTVGRVLAGRLGFAFCDTDALVGESSGVSVSEIVRLEGWEGFRARESKALAAAAGSGTVIATGGGMVLDERNRRFMRDAGTVFYLAAPLECLYSRLERSRKSDRPSLTGGDPLAEMAFVFAQRESLYRECTHHSVDASVPAAKVAGAILHILQLDRRE
jgi:shikimate kinase